MNAGGASPVPRATLAPGYEVARIINGGWQLAAGHDRSGRVRERREVLDQLLRLVDAGFTTFDCADIYIGVEELLGELLRLVRRRGGPEIQIHTKLVPDRSALPTIDRRYVARIVDRSLARLGVERLDLVQFHWWDYEVPGFLETAGWLDELRRAGKIRLLGATNFDLEHLETMVEGGIPLASHQVQYSLLDRRPENGMVDFCRAHGIALLCYGTLAGGFLGPRHLGAAAPEEPLANRSLVKYRLIIEEAGGWGRFQDLLAGLDAIARRHGVSIATVAARWVLDRPGVAAAIVGARDDRHLEANRRLFELRLDADDRRRLAEILARLDGPAGEVYALERRPDGRHARIMKTDLNRP